MKLRITVEGKTYEVDVEVLEDDAAGHAPAPVHAPPPVVAAPATPRPSTPASAAPAPPAAGGGKVFPSPLAGTIRAINIKPGDTVARNQEMIVLEAMKMETSISAAADGIVKAILVNVGDAVQSGQGLVEFE